MASEIHRKREKRKRNLKKGFSSRSSCHFPCRTRADLGFWIFNHQSTIRNPKSQRAGPSVPSEESIEGLSFLRRQESSFSFGRVARAPPNPTQSECPPVYPAGYLAPQFIGWVIPHCFAPKHAPSKVVVGGLLRGSYCPCNRNNLRYNASLQEHYGRFPFE